MNWTRTVALGGAALAAGYLWARRAWPASELRSRGRRQVELFPELTAANLEGEQRTLPDDFEGQYNLCLFAFQREQQEEVDTWLRGLPEMEGLEVYELPTIYRGGPLFRRWLNRAMQRGIPDREQRARTLTLYLDKERLRRILRMPHERTIYALLVDRKGEILWRTEGPLSPEKLESLREACGLVPA